SIAVLRCLTTGKCIKHQVFTLAFTRDAVISCVAWVIGARTVQARGLALEPDRFTGGTMAERSHRLVIVGGGAGGLELAVRLARQGEEDVLLIDDGQTHVWKPRLHKLAAGMRRGQVDELDYAGLAMQWGFAFERGTLADIDPGQNMLTLAAMAAGRRQAAVAERRIGYEALVLALGGVTPDMGVVS